MPSTQGQYQTLKTKTIYIASKTLCMVKTRTDKFGKNRNNFPIYFKFESLVPKKKNPTTHEITYRIVLDFRNINEQLKYWSYPLRCIDRIFSKLTGSKLFSTLDVRSAYYKITIAEDSRQYTAFTMEYRKYEFLTVPFGIHVVPSYFTIIINETLKGLEFCFAYLDDTIIYLEKKKE